MATTAGKLAGETAIVTAAGQGLGEEISKRFALEGANIAVADINEAEAQRVAGEINAAGGSAIALKCDATKKSEVTAMVDTVLKKWGTVDILINAAGGFHQFAPITEITTKSTNDMDRIPNASATARAIIANAKRTLTDAWARV